MLLVHCRRQKADVERKGCSESLRVADHLILLTECINLGNNILRFCISKNLEVLTLKSPAKGHLLLFTISAIHTPESRHKVLWQAWFFKPQMHQRLCRNIHI